MEIVRYNSYEIGSFQALQIKVKVYLRHLFAILLLHDINQCDLQSIFPFVNVKNSATKKFYCKITQKTQIAPSGICMADWFMIYIYNVCKTKSKSPSYVESIVLHNSDFFFVLGPVIILCRPKIMKFFTTKIKSIIFCEQNASVKSKKPLPKAKNK